MRIDGKAIAENVYAQLKDSRKSIDRPIRLGIIVANTDHVIESFVRIKSRSAALLDVELIRVDVEAARGTHSIIDSINALSAEADGIIVQLPLGPGIDTDAVLRAIPKEKDVDGINPDIDESERLVYAPVAEAVREILECESINPEGMTAVVVGAGRLVGSPVKSLLHRLGADVTVVTLDAGSMQKLGDADIVILGAGDPGFVKPKMIRQGVILIDAGTSETSGKISGDADPACEAKARLFTPVPGGVGPIAVAMIFKNLFALVQE